MTLNPEERGGGPRGEGPREGTTPSEAEPDPASFADRVFALVRRIPPGRAVSYGGVAALLGAPRAARGVGRALSTLPADTDVPWWRVVNRNGEISIKGAPGLPVLQRTLLEEEGVEFDDGGRLSWDRHGWRGPDAPR